MTDKNKLAFPIQEAYSMSTEQGMTLRDYFAAKAMQGILFSLNKGIKSEDCKSLAKDAYFLADAMMKAREA